MWVIYHKSFPASPITKQQAPGRVFSLGLNQSSSATSDYYHGRVTTLLDMALSAEILHGTSSRIAFLCDRAGT